MKSIVRVLAVALMLTAFNLPGAAPASAGSNSYLSFGFSGPNMSFNYRRYPRYRYYGYGPYDYGPRYYSAPRYYSPNRYRGYSRSRGRSCSYWRDRCAKRWGYGGKNYRGCLRYHRCR